MPIKYTGEESHEIQQNMKKSIMDLLDSDHVIVEQIDYEDFSIDHSLCHIKVTMRDTRDET